MSRAYRISVKESVRSVIRAEDHVQTHLEVLEVLPCDQMAELLAKELAKIGFQREGDEMARTDDKTRIVVDLESSSVTVSVAADKDVNVSGNKSGLQFDDRGQSAKQIRERLQKELGTELEAGVNERRQALQKELTDRLESELADIRRELDQAANRATAEALKVKAAQLGQIKEVTEDPQSGSMTIVVEL